MEHFTTATSTDPDIAIESKSMLPKMTALMSATVKYEVDFEEAAKDCSNIFLWWIDNQPAGTRALFLNTKIEMYVPMLLW